MIIKHNPAKRVVKTPKVEEVKIEEPIVEILPLEEDIVEEDLLLEEEDEDIL